MTIIARLASPPRDFRRLPRFRHKSHPFVALMYAHQRDLLTTRECLSLINLSLYLDGRYNSADGTLAVRT